MFAIISSRMIHVFRTEDELAGWLNRLFQDAIDRRETYRELVSENVDAVLDLCMRNAPEKTVHQLVRSLDLIQRTLGSIYDPEGSLFILERRQS